MYQVLEITRVTQLLRRRKNYDDVIGARFPIVVDDEVGRILPVLVDEHVNCRLLIVEGSVGTTKRFCLCNTYALPHASLAMANK